MSNEDSQAIRKTHKPTVSGLAWLSSSGSWPVSDCGQGAESTGNRMRALRGSWLWREMWKAIGTSKPNPWQHGWKQEFWLWGCAEDPEETKGSRRGRKPQTPPHHHSSEGWSGHGVIQGPGKGSLLPLSPHSFIHQIAWSTYCVPGAV